MARTRAEELALAQARARQSKKERTPTKAPVAATQTSKGNVKAPPSVLDSLVQSFKDVIGVSVVEDGLKGKKRK